MSPAFAARLSGRSDVAQQESRIVARYQPNHLFAYAMLRRESGTGFVYSGSPRTIAGLDRATNQQLRCTSFCPASRRQLSQRARFCLRRPRHHDEERSGFRICPEMSSAAKELRRRIAGISNAEKLIDAMRLIAASRIRYSSHAALSMRPFAERLQHMLGLLVQKIKAEGRDIETVATKVRQEAFGVLGGMTVMNEKAQKNLIDRMYVALLDSNASSGTTLIVVISGDRGFCGGYNKSVIYKACKRIDDVQKVLPEKKVELFCIGSSAASYFAKHRPDLVIRGQLSIGKVTSALDTAAVVCDHLLSSFISAEVDRVEFVYTRFVSLLANQASVRTLLPVSPSGIESLGDEIFQLTTRNGRLSTIASYTEPPKVGEAAVDYVMTDQDTVLLLNAMLPMYVSSQVTRMIREGMAAELACRLSAMNAARDNAKEMQKKLQMRYNRERQAAITTEIMELVSHADEAAGALGRL